MLSKLKSILPTRQKLGVIVSLSFACAFMIIVFSPLDIYLHNPTSFVVSWRIILPPLLIACLSVTLFLSLILIILSKSKALSGIILLIMWGMLISGYIQTLFLNGEMIAITGFISDHSIITRGRLANLFLWAAIAFLPLGLWCLFHLSPTCCV